MFKYTKASINILVDDVKKIAKIFKWASAGFTLAFTLYQIISRLINQNSLVIINIIMLVLLLASNSLDIFLKNKEQKNIKKISKRAIKWVKMLVKAFSLGVTLVDIYEAGTNNTGISIILATLMILLWILSLVAELLVEFIGDHASEILIGFKADVDDIKKPFTAVSNTVKKITGKYEKPVVDEKKEKVLNKLKDRINKDKIVDEDDE